MFKFYIIKWKNNSFVFYFVIKTKFLLNYIITFFFILLLHIQTVKVQKKMYSYYILVYSVHFKYNNELRTIEITFLFD